MFVAGGSGLIGGFLLRELLHQPGSETVSAFVRSPLSLHDPRLRQVRVDFAKLADVDLDAAGADLYCTLGTTIRKAGSQAGFRAVDHDAALAFARWGFARGAARFFIVTALGSEANAKVFYNRVKGEVEADLRKVGFSELHIFRPSLLLGHRSETRLAEQVASRLAKPLQFIFRGPLAKYAPIRAEVVAKAMVAVARARPSVAGVHIYESDRIATLGQ